jgi:spore photoproduct lyase family protein
MHPLLDITTIHLEPAVLDHPRGREILARFPDAQRIEVEAHNRIPGLFGNAGNVASWNRIKGSTLVLGVKKGLGFVVNGRSSDFLPPSIANGCAMSCAYCYVPRNKGYANPITVFVNIERIMRAIERHAAKQGMKLQPSQTDPRDWVYDIGVNSDCSVDALISDNVKDLVELFRTLPNAKATFATKYVNDELLDLDPRGRTRIRFSLMPADTSRLLDVRTSPIDERIDSVDRFVEAGYEVHLNLSPVVHYEGWERDYEELFRLIDARISPAAKAQLKAEVIFLTHNDRLHEVNLGWHPRAEALLWTPETQEAKVSQMGGRNVRYRRGFKGTLVSALTGLLRERMPYCEVRYAF